MKAYIILDNLRRNGYKVRYEGIDEREIYAAQINVLNVEEAGFLCIMSERQYEKVEQIHNLDILIVKEEKILEKILWDIQKLLVEDMKRKDAVLKLQNDISRGAKIDYIVKECSEIMRNPILIINKNFEVICKYPKTDIWEEHLIHAIERVKVWKEAGENSYFNSSPKCRVQRILLKDEWYYICAIDTCDMINDLDLTYWDRIGEIFSSTIKRKTGNLIIETVKKLLEGNCVFPEEEKNKLFRMGWRKYDKYYIFAVKKTDSNEKISRQLKELLKTEVYNLENHYVMFLHSEKYVEYTEKNFSEVNEFLKSNGLLGVLSMGFWELASCSIRYEQCRACIEVCGEELKAGLVYYGRYQMNHMLRCLNDSNSYDLRNFCCPIVLQLYEIDKKEKTEYLETLFVYICSGQAVKQSAEAMHIHVNTMYMRINKLKDKFKIDFGDLHMLYALHNSIIFLYMYDHTCIGNGYPFL